MVVVLVVGLVTVVAASLIAWKVRSGEKTSIGMNWALVHVRFVWQCKCGMCVTLSTWPSFVLLVHCILVLCLL